MTGYYGKYAVCRNLTLEDIEAKLKAGLTYVLRLRSAGSPDKEIVFHDRIMGEIKLPEISMILYFLRGMGFLHTICPRHR